MVTFRTSKAVPKDIVIHIFPPPAGDGTPILNPQGVIRDRVGDSMGDAADKFLSLLLQTPHCFGGTSEVRRQQRALNLAFTGDLTLLREQTVEPLSVVGVLLHADRYLPSCLRTRVRAIILKAELDFSEWRGQLMFVTDNPTDAEQVGNLIAAWFDLANTLGKRLTGRDAGDRLRAALQASTVTIRDNRVTATSAIPASILVRVAREVAGHGDGCAPGGVCAPTQIAVCHDQGNQTSITLCVPPATVAEHLAHGDTCGPCPTP